MKNTSFLEENWIVYLVTSIHSVIHMMRLSSIYFYRAYVSNNWNRLRLFLMNGIFCPIPMPQIAIFGFINGIQNSVTNHILLIFKLRVYKSRKRGTLELSRLINEIQIRKLSPKSCKETGLNGRKLTEQERYNILLK